MSAARRMLSAISFGVFWRLAPSTIADHAVEEGLARIGRDPDHEPVGEDAGPAGDGAPVAARLPDDRGALTRDGALVDGRDADDGLAVARDELARLDEDDVALAELGARHLA